MTSKLVLNNILILLTNFSILIKTTIYLPVSKFVKIFAIGFVGKHENPACVCLFVCSPLPVKATTSSCLFTIIIGQIICVSSLARQFLVCRFCQFHNLKTQKPLYGLRNCFEAINGAE